MGNINPVLTNQIAGYSGLLVTKVTYYTQLQCYITLNSYCTSIHIGAMLNNYCKAVNQADMHYKTYLLTWT